jgi:hypothetical protein
MVAVYSYGVQKCYLHMDDRVLSQFSTVSSRRRSDTPVPSFSRTVPSTRFTTSATFEPRDRCYGSTLLRYRQNGVHTSDGRVLGRPAYL